ncbi:unnamed protein product [Rotaria magnacalcarata]
MDIASIVKQTAISLEVPHGVNALCVESPIFEEFREKLKELFIGVHKIFPHVFTPPRSNKYGRLRPYTEKYGEIHGSVLRSCGETTTPETPSDIIAEENNILESQTKG